MIDFKTPDLLLWVNCEKSTDDVLADNPQLPELDPVAKARMIAEGASEKDLKIGRLFQAFLEEAGKAPVTVVAVYSEVKDEHNQ